MEMEELERRLSAAGAAYRTIPVPDDMQEKLDKTLQKAGRTHRFRIPAIAAAAMLALVVLPNTGANIAYAMGNIPVVGKLFQAVTFRDYQYEDDRFHANVESPQITAKDITPGTETMETSGELEAAIDQINFDIEKTTEQLIAEFEASVQLGESYNDLEIHHETVTDDEQYFALKLFIYQGAGSGTQSYKIYTIDKASGKQIQLGDIFRTGSDYNTRISDNIREQMRAAMAEDASKAYWIDQDDMPDLNWQGLTAEQNFYFDAAGNLVVAFDEYEIAPGYMGAQEFTVEKAVYEDLLK